MASLETQLREQLGDAVNDKEVMNICVDICKMFELTPESLRYKWEALKYNSADLKFKELGVENARNLRVSIKRDLESKAETATKLRLAASTSKTRPNRPFGNVNFLATPQRKEFFPDRNSVDVHDISGSPIRFEAAHPPKPYRYMFEKLSERSECLDTRIDKFAGLLRKHYRLEELGDPAAVTEHEVVVIGRIVGGSDSKLQESTLMLESSRTLGSGARIPLRFEANFTIQGGLPSINLWPGMIFAARGKNGGGGWFSVTDFIELPMPPRNAISLDSILPFSVTIINGPFTNDSDEDLRYQTLQMALGKLKEQPPRLLLLLGPFLDSSHPSMRTGRVLQAPQILFAQRFSKPLHAFSSQCPSTRIVLVSSVKDTINAHFVFPQGAMSTEGLKLPATAVVLPNPCSFSINGISFGVSTADVLFHARKEGISKRTSAPGRSPDEVDNMQEFCRQIVSQRSFYSVFPVPKDNSHEVNLDVSHLEMLDFESVCGGIDAVPDVLILPSMLKQFRKTAEGVTVVNPPIFAKGQMVTEITCEPSGKASIEEALQVTFTNVI